MKILLVDDESSKINNIYKCLRKINNDKFNVDNDVTYTINLPEAKKYLTDNKFDLLILDLNMPKIIGEDLDENSGLELINDILNEERYCIPNEIIILTEYSDLWDKVAKQWYSNMLTILKYDEQSQEWETKINDKIRFNLIKESKITNVDIVLMTAVQVEFEAVKNSFERWEIIDFKGDLTHYFLTSIKNCDNKDINIILVKQNEMGMTATATLASKIIIKFNPCYIIMCGIAACLKNEYNYGDIILPFEVWNYSSGKIISAENDNDFVLLQDPKYIRINSELKSMLSLDYNEILYTIRKEWYEPISQEINLLHEPMACGPSVVANESYIKENILRHARKTIGLDMESYGLFYACENFNTKTRALCIKSVSDFANDKKGDDYQKYASYTSACFVKYLIEKVLPIK